MASDFEAIMEKFLEEFNARPDEEYTKEFMSLKAQSQKYKESNRYPADSGQMSINRKKNRFKDILPFEYTRVELHPVEGITGSDYINANYILGADGEISYIASQGPLPNTLEDFWRMLWYHNIEVLVMACREVEMGKKKCEMYWPVVHRTVQHGAITITTLREENISNDFVIRDFSLECQGEKQSIRQYHYNAWPDHGRPNSPDPIIRMVEMINDFRKRQDVPLVVHCSAGCGRTGTLIGIDIARSQLLAKEVPADFSVFKIVEKMRQQRPAMVQAKDQYAFVYSAIAELSRRATGYNPTLPPKPAVKPVPTGPPKLSYINIDLDNPRGSSNHTPNPAVPFSSSQPSGEAAPTSKAPGRGPSLPEKQSASSPTEEHMYQNISPSTSSSSLKQSRAVAEGKDESEPHTIPTVCPRPSAMQRSISSSPTSNNGNPPVPPERTKDEDKLQPHPMPKPRARSKKGSSAGAISSSTSSSVLPPSSPAVQPPPAFSKPMLPPVPAMTSRPPSSGAPKLGPPPSVTPRVKVVAEDVTEKPSRLVERPEPSPPLSPTRVVVAAAGDQGKIKHANDEDEFGYGVINIFEVPKLPRSPKPARPESGKTSLMDTFRDILGDELVQSIERQKTPPPLPPPNQAPLLPPPNPPASPRKSPTPYSASRPLPVPPTLPSTTSLDFTEDAPPEVPCRTEARLELMNDGSSAPTYEMPGAITTFTPGGLSPPSTDYEQPTPPVSKSLTASGGLHLSKSPPPKEPQSSLSTPNTFSRSSNTSTSYLGKGGGKLGSLFNKLNKKPDNKKKNASSVEDLASMPVPKPSSMSSSQSSLEKNCDDKYRFPGPLGYGIRLERPTGPRDEPGHWKNVPIPSAIKVT